MQPLTQLRVRTRRQRVRIAILLLVLAAALGFWLQGLLFRPVQTPLVAVLATDYEWPFPPNAWAREDLDGLQTLHGRTVHLVEASANGRPGSDILREIGLQMSSLSARHRHSPCLIVYVSMHGAVDAQGEPCLVPPGASPHDTGTWLPSAQPPRLLEDESASRAGTQATDPGCRPPGVQLEYRAVVEQFCESSAGRRAAGGRSRLGRLELGRHRPGRVVVIDPPRFGLWLFPAAGAGRSSRRRWKPACLAGRTARPLADARRSLGQNPSRDEPGAAVARRRSLPRLRSGLDAAREN